MTPAVRSEGQPAVSDVSVNQAPMQSSLLGMACLKRMKSFEVQGRKLTVRWL